MIGFALSFLAMPTETQAQIGTCFICDYEEVNPCTGAFHGAQQCAQTAPNDCDLYGDVCEPTFSALDIAPHGADWASSELRGLAALALTEGSGATLRSCQNAVLVSVMPVEEADRVRRETDQIVI